MKLLRMGITPLAILCAFIAFTGCKAKKLPPKPDQPPAAAPAPPPAATPPAPVVTQVPPPPPQPPAAPNYNFNNIQFEFDSSVLKTDAYPTLDQVAAAMKTNTSMKFSLKGYASIEGTEDHNAQLSQDRANAVKTYLVNAGVSSAQLNAQGMGTTNPVGDNSTEDGRVLNRRVEIHLAQ
jgi:OOP family OmpA-OmpF porin